MKKSLASRLLVLPLAILLSVVPVFADTIRLKDGSVLRGQVIGFKDQQFTILLGGARGRRSRIMVYQEDVESIEFDSATTAAASTLANDDTGPINNNSEPITQPTRPNSQPVNTNPPPRTANAPTFFQVNVKVRGDNAGNGWTNSGLVVRR